MTIFQNKAQLILFITTKPALQKTNKQNLKRTEYTEE